MKGLLPTERYYAHPQAPLGCHFYWDVRRRAVIGYSINAIILLVGLFVPYCGIFFVFALIDALIGAVSIHRIINRIAVIMRLELDYGWPRKRIMKISSKTLDSFYAVGL